MLYSHFHNKLTIFPSDQWHMGLIITSAVNTYLALRPIFNFQIKISIENMGVAAMLPRRAPRGSRSGNVWQVNTRFLPGGSTGDARLECVTARDGRDSRLSTYNGWVDGASTRLALSSLRVKLIVPD